jgi:hypothetical protein
LWQRLMRWWGLACASKDYRGRCVAKAPIYRLPHHSGLASRFAGAAMADRRMLSMVNGIRGDTFEANSHDMVNVTFLQVLPSELLPPPEEEDGVVGMPSPVDGGGMLAVEMIGHRWNGWWRKSVPPRAALVCPRGLFELGDGGRRARFRECRGGIPPLVPCAMSFRAVRGDGDQGQRHPPGTVRQGSARTARPLPLARPRIDGQIVDEVSMAGYGS